MKKEADHRREQLKRATDRIQREIEEVTEREHELRNVGSIKTTSDETVDSKVHRMPQALITGKLKRTTSTPQILEPTLTQSTNNLTHKMTNGVISSCTTPKPLRFATSPSQKGLMHKFLATRGKIYNKNNNDYISSSQIIQTPKIVLNPESIKALGRSLDNNNYIDNDEPKKPQTRKGYVPVEQKIQKELNEMKERENELRLMRSRMLAKSQPNLLDLGNDNDSDIYDGSGSSLRSGTSTNTLNDDESDREFKGKHKPNPRRRSTLIAQWENLIAAKMESNENGQDVEHIF